MTSCTYDVARYTYDVTNSIADVILRRKRHRRVPTAADCDNIYLDAKTHAHYCELNSLRAAHYAAHFPCAHAHALSNSTECTTADVSEYSADYVSKPEMDLFCSLRSCDRGMRKQKSGQSINVTTT